MVVTGFTPLAAPLVALGFECSAYELGDLSTFMSRAPQIAQPNPSS